MEKTAPQPPGNRQKKAIIVILATVFVVALTVALLGLRRDKPVIVKGNLSAEDIKEIKRNALKELHARGWLGFKQFLKKKAYGASIDALKFSLNPKIKEIEAQGPDAALVKYDLDLLGRKVSLHLPVRRETNGWQFQPIK